MAERRLIRLDLRDKVQGLWDESIPIVRQWVIEGIGIHHSVLDSEQHLLDGGVALCELLELNILETHSHRFEPQGLTVVLLLQESHLAMHSWPEKNYLHIDLVTCKKSKTDLARICTKFSELFTPSNVRGFAVKY